MSRQAPDRKASSTNRMNFLKLWAPIIGSNFSGILSIEGTGCRSTFPRTGRFSGVIASPRVPLCEAFTRHLPHASPATVPSKSFLHYIPLNRATPSLGKHLAMNYNRGQHNTGRSATASHHCVEIFSEKSVASPVTKNVSRNYLLGHGLSSETNTQDGFSVESCRKSNLSRAHYSRTG